MKKYKADLSWLEGEIARAKRDLEELKKRYQEVLCCDHEWSEVADKENYQLSQSVPVRVWEMDCKKCHYVISTTKFQCIPIWEYEDESGGAD